ncbi:MAG: response regulator [Bryobacterales bacterium]|nr:response regulator [Bryobacterales bacterium]
MESTPAESCRVLVVEDERHIARLLEFVLSRAGYTVRTAYDGTSAVAALESFQPHAVVLDLVLPDLSGGDVLKAIRQSSACANAGVLVLSAHTFELDAPSLDPGGRTMYASKPIAPTRLLEKLREFGALVPAVHPSD